jgi:hypothetical protein
MESLECISQFSRNILTVYFLFAFKRTFCRTPDSTLCRTPGTTTGYMHDLHEKSPFGCIEHDIWVIPCQLDKLMSPWVENFKIDIFRGFYIQF